MDNALKDLVLILWVAAVGSNLVLAQGLGLRWFSPAERRPEGVVREGAAWAVMIFLAAFGAAWLNLYINGETARLGASLAASFILCALGRTRFSCARREAAPVLLFAAAMIVMLEDMPPAEAACYGFGAGCGVLLATVLAAGISERLDFTAVPKVFKSAPVFFISLGIISLVFHSFRELSKMHY